MNLDALLEQLADLIADRVAARLNGNGNTPNIPAPAERLLTAAEVAQRLGCSTRYVYAKVGTFPFTVRVGGMVRFSNAGLEQWIKGRRRE